jgi:hypothetical protein
MSTIAGRDVAWTTRAAERDTMSRGELTRDELVALAEVTARELLGVSADDAFEMLDRGELDGTVAGDSLRSLRWLIDA